MGSVWALLGLLIAIGSAFTNAIVGSQLAIIGASFILMAILIELRGLRRDMKQ